MVELFPELKVFCSQDVLLLNDYHGQYKTSKNYRHVIYTSLGEACNHDELCAIIDYFDQSHVIVVTPRKYQNFYHKDNRHTIISIPSAYAWYAKNIPDLKLSVHDREFSKVFLSLNRRAQWNRQALLQFLVKFNLLDQFYFSYHCSDRFNHGIRNVFDDVNRIIGDTWFNQGLDLDQMYNMLPVSAELDQPGDIGDIDWMQNGSSLFYTQSLASVVNETYIDQNHDAFLTEKIFKPIAYGHPFLLFSSAGALKLLQDLGFNTFSDVFDESYDRIEHPQLRFEQILREILRVCRLPASEINSIYKKIIPKLAHNQQFFFDQFASIYDQDIQQTVDQIHAIVNT